MYSTLISFAAERVGSVLPEEVVVWCRQIFFIVEGFLTDLSGSLFGDAIFCVFVFCLVDICFVVFLIVHIGHSFPFLDSICKFSHSIHRKREVC